MKTTAIYRKSQNTRPNIPYPNAATRHEIAHKILNLLLSAVCGAALAAIALFLMVLV